MMIRERGRGSSEQFERKGANKRIDGKNLQLSPDSVISEVPGTIGDITQGSGLECFQAHNNVGPRQGPEYGRCCICQGISKKNQVNRRFSAH